jgi:DNA-binding NtrC family response regulator
MSCRTLLIQDTPDRVNLDIVNLLPSQDRKSCTELIWNAVRIKDLIASDVRLIVAVAHSRPSEAIEMFRDLSGHSHNKLAFAVLPRQIDGQLLQDASGLVDDFALWPSSRDEIAQRLRRLVSPSGGTNESVSVRLLKDIGFAQLVGEDPVFLRALEKIPIMAESQAPVLITGETGTGKEFSARAIHHLGKRRNCAFVPLDCGAIPDQVFENEMFGHVRGAYTDAHSDQKGLATIADGGTLFLDEVDSLSPAAQSKLLRFLQERTFKPLGSPEGHIYCPSISRCVWPRSRPTAR